MINKLHYNNIIGQTEITIANTTTKQIMIQFSLILKIKVTLDAIEILSLRPTTMWINKILKLILTKQNDKMLDKCAEIN